MKRVSWLLVLGMLIFTLVGCSSAENNTQSSTNAPKAQPTELIVSAAASLGNSLTELQKDYTQKQPNVSLKFNFAASGTLQQQIEKGAPADIFISAATTQMNNLDKENLVIKDSEVNLLANDLVLVVGKDNTKITSLDDLTKADHIAIGTPASVPAGKYAEDSLKTLKLWDSLQSKFVMGKDVTTVLNYVATGNADAGFVYRSDAQSSNQVKVAAVVPDNSHKPIVYPAAVVTATKNKQAAQDFLTYLKSPDAQQVFEKYGFKVIAK